MNHDLVSAIMDLSSRCARECGGNALVEVWLSARAYDALSLEAIRAYEIDENTPANYMNGLVDVYCPGGKVRVRRAA